MPLIDCRDCGTPVSDGLTKPAQSCPKCGASAPAITKEELAEANMAQVDTAQRIDQYFLGGIIVLAIFFYIVLSNVGPSIGE